VLAPAGRSPLGNAGSTPSGTHLTTALEDVNRGAKGALMSLLCLMISRIQQVVEVAQRLGGRSPSRFYNGEEFKMARQLATLNPDDAILSCKTSIAFNRPRLHLATARRAKPSLFGATARLGSPSRAARDAGDTIVLCRTQSRQRGDGQAVSTGLFQRGANVVYHPVAPCMSPPRQQEEQ
jgi:hypothetical protein